MIKRLIYSLAATLSTVACKGNEKPTKKTKLAQLIKFSTQKLKKLTP